MKVFVFFLVLTLFVSVPSSYALRAVWSLDQIVERSDVIVIGTIESTWVDIRPFDDYVVVDTAKIKVNEWLKSEMDSDVLEIRYYGYWAKMIDDFRGKHIFDNPVHSYESGQKVLLHLFYEKPTMVMGEGYYPSYEGGYIIHDDTITSQNGEQMKLEDLRKIIGNTLENNLDAEPETKPMLCEPTDYEKTRKCLDYYHCNVDENPALNEDCIDTDKGISVRNMCSNPNNIIIQKSNGCMILPMVGVKACGSKYACTQTP